MIHVHWTCPLDLVSFSLYFFDLICFLFCSVRYGLHEVLTYVDDLFRLLQLYSVRFRFISVSFRLAVFPCINFIIWSFIREKSVYLDDKSGFFLRNQHFFFVFGIYNHVRYLSYKFDFKPTNPDKRKPLTLG